MKELNPNAKPFYLHHQQQHKGFNHLYGSYGLGKSDCLTCFEKEMNQSSVLRLQGNCPLGSSCLSCLSIAEYMTLFKLDSSWSREQLAMAESASRKLRLQSYPYFGCSCCFTVDFPNYNTSPCVNWPSLGLGCCVGCEDVPTLVRNNLMLQEMNLGMNCYGVVPSFIRRRDEGVPSVIGQGNNGLHYCSGDYRQNEIGIAQPRKWNPAFSDQFCSTRTSGMNCRSENKGSARSLRRSKTKELYRNDCWVLQHKLHKGSQEEKNRIFEVINKHVVELMMDEHGTYLVQKMLQNSNEEQRMKILQTLTTRPFELVRISLNEHGARSVKELINHLKEEKSGFISALQPCVLDLMKDFNGYQVLLHCLQQLPNEDNKFIFDGAIKFCSEIAIHRYGCCVLGSCITYATEQVQKVLLSKISSQAEFLASETIGNYIIRYILEFEIDSVNTAVMSQFEGKYVMLSKQKYSSLVIEKCLKVFGDEGRETIVNELTSYPKFAMLLEHPYANYVIKAALQLTKGHLKEKLVEAIQPYSASIRKKNKNWECLMHSSLEL